MPRKVRQQKQNMAAAKKPTQKGALAEALRYMGPNASHATLARFVKEQFGMELTFCIVFTKVDTIRKPKGPSTPRQQELSPQGDYA
jgi:hypothetical protein